MENETEKSIESSEELNPGSVIETEIFKQINDAGKNGSEKVINNNQSATGFNESFTPDQINETAKQAEFDAASQAALDIASKIVADVNFQELINTPGADVNKLAVMIADSLVKRKYSSDSRQTNSFQANEAKFK